MSQARFHILILAINYSCQDDIIQMLHSVPQAARGAIDVMVTDNSSDLDATGFAPFEDNFARIDILRPGANLGYFGGAQHALASLDDPTTYDAILIVNPDMIFQDGFWDLLPTALQEAQAAGAGVIFPSVQDMHSLTEANPFMTHRPSRRYIDQRVRLFGNAPLFALWSALSRLRRKLRAKAPFVASDEVSDIYAGHGCLFIFARSYFARGGDFNWAGFLYCEEFFVAETCRRAGLSVRLDKRLKTQHLGQVTTGLIDSAQKRRWTHESFSLLRELYFSDADAAAADGGGERPSSRS